jgi:RNA polymerase sigma factor (sigma-70 family)
MVCGMVVPTLTQLAPRHESALRAVTRFYGLDRWDADDVIQTTWLRFIQHGHTVREPAALRAWLTTTARRECLRLLQRRVREVVAADPAREEPATCAVEAELFAAERSAVLEDALSTLPPRPRALMTVLASEPDLSYGEVGRRIGMPVGSIGPIRARSLVRLRRHAPLRALHAAGF